MAKWLFEVENLFEIKGSIFRKSKFSQLVGKKSEGLGSDSCKGVFTALNY